MSYKEWLFDELCNDGVISEEEVDMEEVTENFLLETTELDTYDLANYREQFENHCKNCGVTPVWDVESHE